MPRKSNLLWWRVRRLRLMKIIVEAVTRYVVKDMNAKTENVFMLELLITSISPRWSMNFQP